MTLIGCVCEYRELDRSKDKIIDLKNEILKLKNKNSKLEKAFKHAFDAQFWQSEYFKQMEYNKAYDLYLEASED